MQGTTVRQPASAEVVPIRGQLRLRIASLTERINSLTVAVRGRPEETGPVVLTLDPAHPRAQTILLDFDTMEIRIETRLLINAPLLRRLRAPPTPIAASERGTFRMQNVRWSRNGRTATMEIAVETRSSGTIESGPLAGATYRNKKDHNHDCTFPANTVRRMAVNLDGGGRVIGATRSDALSSLLCARDEGTLTFSEQERAFAGSRIGRVVP